MGRSKKKNKADFQKIKFKVGKIIPKKNNRTHTNIISKKILLPEQIKNTLPKIGSSRPATLKDILSDLKASKGKIVKTALVRLKERIEEDDNVFDSNFDEIFNAVIRCLETERKENSSIASNIICLIIVRANKNLLDCFKSTINMQLISLLTHPQFEFKERAVKLVYFILCKKPFLLSNSFNILNNVLYLLNGQDDHSKNVIQLPLHTVNLYLWRALILKALNKFLQVIYKYFKEKKEKQLNNEGSLFPAFIDKVPQYNCFDSGENDEIEELKNFVLILMPNIYAIHQEEMALRERNAGGAIVNESISTVKTIFQIIYYLIECFKLFTKENLIMWFKNNESKKFANNLIKYFPYHHLKSIPSNNHKKASISNQKELCHDTNLNFCLIYSTFILGTSCAKPYFEKTLITYLKDSINEKLGKNYQFSIIIDIARNFFKDNLHSDSSMELLEYLVQIVQEFRYTEEVYMIVNLFFEFVLQSTYHSILESEPFIKFIEHLVYLLLKCDFPYTENLSSVVNILCNRQYKPLINSCEKYLYELIEIIPKKNENIQLILFTMIIYIPKFSSACFAKINEIAIEPSVNICHIYYLKHMLTNRLLNDDLNFKGEDYIMFIFNLMTGNIFESYNRHNIREQLSIGITNDDKEPFIIICPCKNLKHKLELYECGIGAVISFSNTLPIFSHIQSFATLIMQMHRHSWKMPVNVAIALLKIFKEINTYMPNEVSERWQLELTLASLLYAFILPWENDDSVDKGYSELLSSLSLSDDSALVCIKKITNKVHPELNKKLSYCFLRMLDYLINSGYLINIRNLRGELHILGKIKQNFSELLEEPWINNLFEHFAY